MSEKDRTQIKGLRRISDKASKANIDRPWKEVHFTRRKIDIRKKSQNRNKLMKKPHRHK